MAVLRRRVQVGDQAREHRRTPHLELLLALPSIRVAQYKVDVAPKRLHELLAIRVALLNVVPGAFVQVPEKVREHVDGRFFWGERWHIRIFHVPGCERLRAKVQLKPDNK